MNIKIETNIKPPSVSINGGVAASPSSQAALSPDSKKNLDERKAAVKRASNLAVKYAPYGPEFVNIVNDATKKIVTGQPVNLDEVERELEEKSRGLQPEMKVPVPAVKLSATPLTPMSANKRDSANLQALLKQAKEHVLEFTPSTPAVNPNGTYSSAWDDEDVEKYGFEVRDAVKGLLAYMKDVKDWELVGAPELIALEKNGAYDDDAHRAEREAEIAKMEQRLDRLNRK